MNRRIDTAEYTRVPGRIESPTLRLYALSTCAFCERAMRYLEAKGFAYEYIFIDRIPADEKREMKLELKAEFGNIPVFPFLVIDGSATVSGFSVERWDGILGVES